jgi:hypothetical protein
MKARTASRPSVSEGDVAWTEERTIALMHLGLKLTDAVELAARECSQRVADRERDFLVALAAQRQRHHEERERRDTAERAKRRAELEASATQAKPDRPGTLQASLGDLLRFKGR